MFLQRSKNAVADLIPISLKEITCQGLQRHPFREKIKWKAWPEGQPVLLVIKQKFTI